MPFVAGAGFINVDLIYAGMAALPPEGREAYASGFSMQLGGGVVATMALLGHLGVPARVGTYWGDDLFSGWAEKQLAAHPLQVQNLYTGHGMPLSLTSVANTPQDRTFWSYVERPEIGEAELERVYTLCRGASVVEMQPGYLPVYRRLKAEGTRLVLDLGWDDELGSGKYEEYLQLADFFTPNRAEALAVTGAATVCQAAERLGKYFNAVIIKLDSEGCLVAEGTQQYIISSIPHYTRVDSTGAGDAFLAGFIYGLYRGAGLAQCVLYGNITGGNCVAGVGCISSPLTEAGLLAQATAYSALLP